MSVVESSDMIAKRRRAKTRFSILFVALIIDGRDDVDL